jgi:hypothetical protein
VTSDSVRIFEGWLPVAAPCILLRDCLLQCPMILRQELLPAASCSVLRTASCSVRSVSRCVQGTASCSALGTASAVSDFIWFEELPVQCPMYLV